MTAFGLPGPPMHILCQGYQISPGSSPQPLGTYSQFALGDMPANGRTLLCFKIGLLNPSLQYMGCDRSLLLTILFSILIWGRLPAVVQIGNFLNWYHITKPDHLKVQINVSPSKIILTEARFFRGFGKRHAIKLVNISAELG